MAVAASLLVLSVSSVVVNAVTPFGPNVRVSAEPTLATERKPAAAADAFGNVYVVWAQNRNGDPDLYFGKSADGGITWSAPTRIGGNPPSGSTQDRPSVALGPNGEIVVAWQDDRLTYFDFDIYASISFNAGGTFTTPTKVSDGPAGILQLAPALAVNNRGHVAVAWQDYRTGNGAIRLSTATVGTFGFGPSVRVDDDPGPWTAAAPSVAETATGTIYVAYHDNRSGSADVYLARSLDGGSSFGASVRVDDTGAAGSAQGLISIAVDGLGRIYATWEDSRAGEVETDGRPIFDIYFALSTDAGASFSRNVRVDDGPRKSSQEAPRIAVGAAGTVYVVWDDARNTDWDPYFSYSTNAGATFAPSIRVDDAGDSTTDPPLQYDPQVVESRTGLVFAVWEDNRGPTGDIYGATAYLAVGSGLHVRIDLDAEMAWPGDAVGLTVRVTSNGTAVDGVSIGLASSTSGAFGAVQRTGPGVYHSSFTSSPSTPDGTDIVLTATAQKSGYVTGASQALLHVRKVILAAVEPTWDLLAVGQTMQVRASATAHGAPLPDAAAQSGAGGAGTIDPGSGITDAQGLWSTWFTPASGAGGSDATITLAVSKDGYLPATAQVAVPILAQPRPVDVLLTSGTREMMSRERANLRVELTSGGVGVTRAILSPFCVRGGTFSAVTETGAGVYLFSWDAPDVPSITWVSIGVRIQRGGYNDASAKLAVLVDPNMSNPTDPTQLFVAAYSESPTVQAGHSVGVTVYAYTMQGYTVSGASITVVVAGGLGSVTALVDELNGRYTFVFTAAYVTSNTGIFLRIDVSKLGYATGNTRVALLLLP